MTVKVSEILAEASDHVRMGWVQNSYTTQDGRVCSIAAVERAAMNHLLDGGIQACEPAKELLQKKLRAVLGEENFIEGVSIPSMNDHPNTDREAVEAAFDKAVIAAEEHGE